MIFLGFKAGFAPQVFRDCPKDEAGNPVYNAVVGPFKTLRGAYYMAEHGRGNPHCQTVNEAELLARKQAKERTR